MKTIMNKWISTSSKWDSILKMRTMKLIVKKSDK